MNTPPDLLVMGVSGSGKTTIGTAIAAAIGSEFLDADDFHPAENIRKMAAGIPLDDADRLPWLEAIHQRLTELRSAGRSFVLACSALKKEYRERLEPASPGWVIIFLEGSPELIRERLLTRKDHFMPPALLDSQFAALEPAPGAIRLDIQQPVSTLVAQLLHTLQLHV